MCFAAVSCSERGIKSHLLLRGEQPEILTGYNLMSTIYGNVTYVPRSLYANREKMLKSHADYLAGSSGNVIWFDDIMEASLSENDGAMSFLQKDAYRSDHPRKIVIVNEGAGDVVALLGNFTGFGIKNHLFGYASMYTYLHLLCVLVFHWGRGLLYSGYMSSKHNLVFAPNPPTFFLMLHICNSTHL